MSHHGEQTNAECLNDYLLITSHDIHISVLVVVKEAVILCVPKYNLGTILPAVE